MGLPGSGKTTLAADLSYLLSHHYKCHWLNADKVRFTGQKMQDKVYRHYTGYPGGQKTYTAQELMARKPNDIVERAVKGMLPKNRLGRKMFKKLFVYAGASHPHSAQQPTPFKF